MTEWGYVGRFTRGDKVRLTESISVSFFVGGFKDIFSNDPRKGYKFKTIDTNEIMTILDNSNNDKGIVVIPNLYKLKLTNGDTIVEIPEYLLSGVK